MARYARGKKSNAMSDISGFKVRYKDLKTTWNNLRVEPEEYDPKQPQLNPAKNIIDATALFKPRPDNDPDNVLFVVGFTQDWTIDPRLLPGIGMHGRGAIGAGINAEVSISVKPTPAGVAGTGEIGTYVEELTLTEAGVAGTGEIGSVALGVAETGLAGTGAIGTSVITLTLTETGVAGTGTTGAFGETDGSNMQLSIPESGVAGTGATGTEAVNIQGWGGSTWGQGPWGD